MSASVHAGMPYPPRDGDPPRMEEPPPDGEGEPPSPDGEPPLDGEPPRMENPPRWRTPPDGEPPLEADSSIRSTSGRYASYWNAFLFFKEDCTYLTVELCRAFFSKNNAFLALTTFVFNFLIEFLPNNQLILTIISITEGFSGNYTFNISVISVK